jgi:hypothetical protein
MYARRVCSVVIALGSLVSTACAYDNGQTVETIPDNSSQNAPIYKATIDADATMTGIVPGDGVGMFVEYGVGGTWTVKFSCDTNATTANYTCPWSIDAQTLDGTAISGVDVQKLDSDDAVTQSLSRPDQLRYDGLTTTEIDEFSFQVGAGKPVGFEIWLNYEPNPNRYVFWIGDGGLNKGISGPKFNLYPNQP